MRAERVTALGERGFAFDLVRGGDAHRGAGRRASADSTVPNALAAAAAALAAGASLGDVAEGLARYQPVGGRMERVALPRNIILINDTYNANPQSMQIALESLAKLKGPSRGIAVLGDMGELGDAALEAHRATGKLVAELGLDHLFALGQFAARRWPRPRSPRAWPRSASTWAAVTRQVGACAARPARRATTGCS